LGDGVDQIPEGGETKIYQIPHICPTSPWDLTLIGALIFRYLRAVAYRWIVRWIFGMLGWENSRPLPACLYNEIRKRYPSQSTTGYKSSQQRT
jgi:hypothetical protein